MGKAVNGMYLDSDILTVSFKKAHQCQIQKDIQVKSGYLPLISLPISLFIGIETVNSLLPFYCFSLNKLKHTCNQFECNEYGKIQKSRFKTLSQRTYC